MATRISSETDLKSIAAILHDARFTADAVDFNAPAQTFNLKCWVSEPKRREGTGFREWKGYRLSFIKVTDCKVNTREKVSYYELATIRFAAGDRRLNLVTHYGIEISLQVGELNGALTEISETRAEWN
jgi:hypothetical protein